MELIISEFDVETILENLVITVFVFDFSNYLWLQIFISVPKSMQKFNKNN
jgi:hypothetical protein